MTTIELSFPARRFHGTPWGRHVNEGTPEWPPSPYRLLRALYDAWKRKHPELPEEEMAALLGALAREAPAVWLPRATASHTRGYLSTNTFDPTDKTLIFDGFVALPVEAKCYFCWGDLQLTGRQAEVLGTLLRSLNYLGRSESWVNADLAAGEGSAAFRCAPLEQSDGSGETVPVACAVPPADYRGKPRWLDALAYSTRQVIQERLSGPPAMRFVQYLRPSDALVTRVARLAPQNARTEAVILGLDSPVLPLVTATIEVAEQVRRRLMGIHRRIQGDAAKVSPRFSGKDCAGRPLMGHQHTFIMPLGNDAGRIVRILLYTRAGFDATEIRAILGLGELHGVGSEKPIRVVATWRGQADDPAIRPAARTVVSATPFVPARHWRRGRDLEEFLAAEARRECANHGLPSPARVERLDRAPGLFEWVEFRRNRKEDRPRPGFGFRLEFAQPVAAPFSLGYGCHFGLGQFDAK